MAGVSFHSFSSFSCFLVLLLLPALVAWEVVMLFLMSMVDDEVEFDFFRSYLSCSLLGACRWVSFSHLFLGWFVCRREGDNSVAI